MEDNLKELLLEKSDLAVNQNPRLPVCLCAEASEMAGNDGNYRYCVSSFIRGITEEAGKNLAAKSSLDLCVLAYGGAVRAIKRYSGIADGGEIKITYAGETPVHGKALEEAYRRYLARRQDYVIARNASFMPVFIFMSRGCPAGEIDGRFRKWADQFRKMDQMKKASVFPVAAGAGDDSGLRLLSYDGSVYGMDGGNVREMLRAFGQSVSRLSSSTGNLAKSLKEDLVAWDRFARR